MTESEQILRSLGPLLPEALDLQAEAERKEFAAHRESLQGYDGQARKLREEAANLSARASALIAEAERVNGEFGKPALEPLHMEIVAGWWRGKKKRREV